MNEPFDEQPLVVKVSTKKALTMGITHLSITIGYGALVAINWFLANTYSWWEVVGTSTLMKDSKNKMRFGYTKATLFLGISQPGDLHDFKTLVCGMRSSTVCKKAEFAAIVSSILFWTGIVVIVLEILAALTALITRRYTLLRSTITYTIVLWLLVITYLVAMTDMIEALQPSLIGNTVNWGPGGVLMTFVLPIAKIGIDIFRACQRSPQEQAEYEAKEDSKRLQEQTKKRLALEEKRQVLLEAQQSGRDLSMDELNAIMGKNDKAAKKGKKAKK